MSWFEDQIKQRKLSDDEVLARAYADMAGVVLGNKAAALLNDSLEQARNAIDHILKFYGIRLKEFPDEIKDLDKDLSKLLHPFGIMMRRVVLTKGWHKDASGPILEEDDTPVALIPGPAYNYILKDAKSGKDIIINPLNEDSIGSQAICFYKPFPLKKLTTLDMLKYIISLLPVSDVLNIGVVTLIATLIGMITPRLTYWLYSDALVKSENFSSLFSIGIFMICVSISTMLINSLKSLIFTRIQRRTLISVEAASMMRILSLPASFFKEYSSGEIHTRMNYITSLSSSLCSIFLSTGLTSVFSIAYITQIFRFAPVMVIPSLVIIFINVGFTVVSTFIQMEISRESMEKTALESGMTYSLISGIQKIKLSGAEKRAFGKWSKLYSEMAKMNYDPPMIIKLNSVISTSIGLLGTIVMYSLALQSSLSVAEYTAFNAAYSMFYGAIASLFGIALEAAGIRPLLKMVEPIFNTVPEHSGNKTIVERLNGNIELSHVSFRYNDDSPLILNNISLKIRSGQYVAIVGRTGCGKSTLLRIMIGFETLKKGSVYYDGNDLKNTDLPSLRSKIGMVLQNGKLINGSIYENICISDPTLSLNEAWEAAELAGLAEDIREMPMGMQTVISEGSGGISGGQKQRLMIARAVAGKPKILMFDEATSALDNKTQLQVSQALDGLKCTRIVIAHRLSTIKNADRILVLNEGRIIEDGTYEELTAAKGFFADLVERQRLDT